MKPQFAILFSLIALSILLLVQGYSISQTFKTKKEQFDMKYTVLVKQALIEQENSSNYNYLDSVLQIIDKMALGYIFRMSELESQGDSLYFRKEILAVIDSLLNKRATNDRYISEYFTSAGAFTRLHSGIFTRQFSLLDFDLEYPIINNKPDVPPEEFSNAILANSFTAEGNHYRISYDYYVDLPDRNRIITQEMSLTLLLAFVTILVVFLIFYLTTRNMLIQKKLSDLKSDFINNMTHELKTPLSTIAVATTTLSDSRITEDREKIAEISTLIRKQNKHLTQLIDRILDISIWEKDQVRLIKKKVHIWEYMKEKLENFRLEHRDDLVTITDEYELDRDYVFFDDIHMTTVINNLLSNAVKYCDRQPVIHVKVFLHDTLVIQVSDNGIGIRKDEQKHVFEKFYRVGKGDFKTVKGLGLGLYYVRQIVQAHDGEVTLTSTPGKGSTFTILIPVNHESFIG
jgi:signal transduction histidine kinase